MFESSRFQRVFLHFGHFDNSLFTLSCRLVGRGISNVFGVIVRFRDVFRLSSLDLALSDLFKGESSTFRGFVDRFGIWSFHLSVFGCHIGSIGQRDEV